MSVAEPAANEARARSQANTPSATPSMTQAITTASTDHSPAQAAQITAASASMRRTRLGAARPSVAALRTCSGASSVLVLSLIGLPSQSRAGVTGALPG